MKLFTQVKSLIILFAIFFSAVSLASSTALMIIDMQPYFAERDGFHTAPLNAAKIQQVLMRQVELIRMAKSNGASIVIVEYEGYESTSDVLMREIGDYSNFVVFKKNTSGLFANNKLAAQVKAYLEARDITDLIVSGANGGSCVRCTIEGALENGLRVWADKDAIIDFNFREFILPYRYKNGSIFLKTGELIANFNQPSEADALTALLARASSTNLTSTPFTKALACAAGVSAPKNSLFKKFVIGLRAAFGPFSVP